MPKSSPTNKKLLDIFSKIFRNFRKKDIEDQKFLREIEKVVEDMTPNQRNLLFVVLIKHMRNAPYFHISTTGIEFSSDYYTELANISKHINKVE